LMYFVYTYEIRTMKPVQIVLGRERKGQRRMMEGVNLIKIHFKYVCKCHNETFLYNSYLLILI
jgi:hypothetical protein